LEVVSAYFSGLRSSKSADTVLNEAQARGVMKIVSVCGSGFGVVRNDNRRLREEKSRCYQLASERAMVAS
jgi:hypothetical protein